MLRFRIRSVSRMMGKVIVDFCAVQFKVSMSAPS
jgi:hypothetical protein